MVSYVILISIVITLSIGVYAWLEVISNPAPALDCKDDTSIILESYECFDGSLGEAGIDLNLENNGRFNIDGIIFAVGDNSQRAPITYLMADNAETVLTEGHHFFLEPLKPGETITAKYSNKFKDQDGSINPVSFDEIQVIQLQPFIITEQGKVICQDAVIKQDVQGCEVGWLIFEVLNLSDFVNLSFTLTDKS